MLRVKTAVIGAAIGLFGAAAASAATLTTSFDSDNGQRGIMFDIGIGSTDLVLTSFDLNLYEGAFPMEVYYREGTHVGNENTDAGWNLLDTTDITSNGVNVATNWDVADLLLAADTTYALYITNTSGGGVNYIDGTDVGAVAATDGDLTIFEGVGKSYPFLNTFSPRVFSGSINYEPVAAAVPLPASLSMLLMGLAGLGLWRRRRIV